MPPCAAAIMNFRFGDFERAARVPAVRRHPRQAAFAAAAVAWYAGRCFHRPWSLHDTLPQMRSVGDVSPLGLPHFHAGDYCSF